MSWEITVVHRQGGLGRGSRDDNVVSKRKRAKLSQGKSRKAETGTDEGRSTGCSRDPGDEGVDDRRGRKIRDGAMRPRSHTQGKYHTPTSCRGSRRTTAYA